MNRSEQHTTDAHPCLLCNQSKSSHLMFPFDLVRPGLASYIRSKHPAIDERNEICLDCLNRMRGEYVVSLMEEENRSLSSLEEGVRSLQQDEPAARNIEKAIHEKATLGDRTADRVATFGGSWKFIGMFGGVMIIWMVVNTTIMGNPFDPYPFILLNLLLSCLAAIQAPIIMMSQNRQEAKDRLRNENDYRINLQAELEIRHLHDKLDLMLHSQWKRLMEIQGVQMEMMEELIERKG